MSQAQPSNSNHDFGADEFLIAACADWHVVRAKQQLIWAENRAATMFGLKPSVGVDTAPLKRMKELEGLLAQAQPRTVLLAQELLNVTATILAHSDRDSVMAEGPLLAIVRNVAHALDYCQAATKVGAACIPDGPSRTEHPRVSPAGL